MALYLIWWMVAFQFYGTVLFLDHELNKAKNLKLLLYAFELFSVLKINFHKSDILLDTTAVFGCPNFGPPKSNSAL
jgi:hypothetical protein